MTQPPDRFAEEIDKEARRIHESAAYSAQGQLEAAKRWRHRHWRGGISAAGLGTGGAILTFAECSPVLAGGVTLLGAIVAASLTGVQPDKLAERAQASGNDYTSLRNAVRRFVNLDLPARTPEESREILEGLANRASALDHGADPIPRWAYERARKNFAEGGQNFGVDQR